MHIQVNETDSQLDSILLRQLINAALSETTNDKNNVSDPFDMDAQPVMYMSDNRTPAMTDMGLIMICIIFTTCLLLLILLMPSIRRNKLRNFVCLALMICMGASIPLALIKNSWMTGELHLSSVPYDSFYRNQFSGLLRVEIGLNAMNVSLIGQVTTTDEESQVKEVHYNERFHFEKPDEMQLEHQEALQRGLPYPILSVSEYFSQDSDGFSWTRHLRQAGFYTQFLLYITFACWLASVLIMCILPAYFMTVLKATCLLSASSYLNYLITTALLMPSMTSAIVIQARTLEVQANYMTLVSAICSILAYYCAQYIEAMAFSDDRDESLTIMDSEDYLKDKKALAAVGLDRMVISAIDREWRERNLQPQARSNSVIVPIADIEQKFGSPRNS